jgi:DNA recombination protein RmuC
MPLMQDLLIGLGFVIGAALGILAGVLHGKGTGKAEVRAHLDHIRSLEGEKEKLEGQFAVEQELNQELNIKVVRAEERAAAQEEKYTQMKTDVDKAFGNLAAEALRANNQSFLDVARQQLGAQTQEARLTLEAREEAIKNLLDPLGAALKSLDEQTRAMEKERTGAYTQVKTLVETMQTSIPDSLESLKNETAQLISALRSPKIRGNWGELQLKRCVEYAGMVEYCSFAEQTTTRDDDDRILRPDMTIQMPNGRTIIVDAKTPLDAFLNMGEGDPNAQGARLQAHAERVKAHLRDLSSKAYWKQFEHTPEFVVCFLPSEALFSAALEADPSLIEFSSQANVVLATPTTLIALLKAVAFGWQQSQVTENAKGIQEAGRDLYNKLVSAHDYFGKLGSALEGAVNQYNKFVGAVEGRGGAFFHARKLGALVHDSSELEFAEPIQAAEPRLLTAEDWRPAAESGISSDIKIFEMPSEEKQLGIG